MNNDDQLDLDGLASPAPPRELEAKTIAELKHLGLVRRRSARPWLVAAAAFALGLALGATRTSAPEPDYLLLLVGGDSPGEAEIDARVQEYAAWAANLRSEGIQITGERLTGLVDTIRSDSAMREDVRGYFLFSGASRARAAEIAESCPHHRYAGSTLLARIAR